VLVKKTENPEPAAPQRVVDCQTWLEQLNAEQANLRRQAVLALAEYPSAVSALMQLLSHENDLTVQEAIFTTLSLIGTPDVVQALMPLLSSESAYLRNNAAEVLQQLPAQIAAYIPELLSNKNPDVRILAINILANLKHPDTPRWLQGIIERDPHVNVCATAVDLLIELGSTETIPALEGLSNRFPDEPFIQFAVTTAINRIQAQQHSSCR
jgi:HEAT repeat protein